MYLIQHAPFPASSKFQFLTEKVLDAVRIDRLLCLHMLYTAGIPVDKPDQNGWTPVMYAVINGQWDIVDYLFNEAKADLDHEDSHGKSVIHHLLDTVSDHHLVFRLLEKQLFTPKMIEVLTDDDTETVVPGYLHVAAEIFVPKVDDKWKQFADAVKSDNDEVACEIILFDFRYIVERTFEEVERLCK